MRINYCTFNNDILTCLLNTLWKKVINTIATISGDLKQIENILVNIFL